MLFTTYGNCQADVLANLLTQSPQFADQYELARLRPCFAVSDQEIKDWVESSASNVHLLITQKLRKGWRGGVELFDTDWLTDRCAPGVARFEWSDMYYSAYEPHMTYPITFPRRQPSDYINLLHVLAYVHGFDWRKLEPFYSDPSVFPVTLIEAAHAQSLQELEKREADCSLKIAPFIATHWREERLFLTFNHPARQVVRHAANQVLEGLKIVDPVPPTGYFGFLATSSQPLLASFDAVLARPEGRSMAASFYLNAGAVPAPDYFDRWEASFSELGRDRMRDELAAQARDTTPKRDLLDVAARYLGINASP